MLFGLIHYTTSDFAAFNTAFFVLFQIGAGLIFNWVILNYGLLQSMIAHSSYNFILIMPVVLSVQFTNENLQYFNNDKIEVQWRKVPPIGAPPLDYIASDSMIIANNIEGSFMYRILKTNSISQKKITQIHNFSKFNFKIVLIDTGSNLKIEDEAKHFFENEMLEILESDDD